MTRTVRNWIRKHKLVISYFGFGIITTVFSLGACFLTLRLGVVVFHDEQGEPTAFLDVLASTIQWVVGVIVSFLTNKRFVFREAEKGLRVSCRQFGTFAVSRVLTYFLEVGVNLGIIALLEWASYRTWTVLGMSLTTRFWAKVVSSVVIVIANYFVSKLLVFRKNEKKGREQTEIIGSSE